ncbi:dolichol-phosphate mannosyltransferase subunit 3-domain-containing protein [Infundibulicybe gibba]|nr:dolichol-phosphate mannosyltransferase subunit 3-domain-containing protein [Infundibulicybe gibba]
MVVPRSLNLDSVIVKTSTTLIFNNTRNQNDTRTTIGALYKLLHRSLLLAFFQYLSVPLIEDSVVQDILPLIPWWILVSFGSYSLWSIGWGLFTFRDCPEAYTELLGEISQAKNDLRAKGITVD